jgi:uncharacterized RDD family membrane protein YckC
VEASAAQNAPVNTTCSQCGSILPSGVRACSFCGFKFSAPGSEPLTAPVWRDEVSQRLASYRARKRKGSADGQPELPFEALTPAPVVAQATAVAEPPAPAEALDDDFSFTIAIGRTANRRAGDEPQMFIDVSLPPDASRGTPDGSFAAAVMEQQHSGLYPVASIEERRIAGLIDAACLLFPWGGFLALFGSIGGHFAFSKLSAAIYAASFALIYLQYFSLFTVFGGTTPGMMLRGLRVVDFSGEEASPRQLLLRAAGYVLSAGTFFLGFLWSQWDEDELTWHDRISHTYLSSAQSITDAELNSTVHSH